MDALNLIALIVGICLLIKKLANMDRYLGLRVLILTSILSCLVVYVFVVYVFPESDSGCVVNFENGYY